jgi:hypothetical protein
LKAEENSNQEPDLSSAGATARAKPRLPRDLSEDEALTLVHQSSVRGETLAAIARAPVSRSRKVSFALATHPRTPRHLSVPLLRRMFTFDLLKVAFTPHVAADLKRVAEEQIILRLEALTPGEKISLARRSPSRVVGALLLERNARVISAALGNTRLRETSVTQALMKDDAPAILFHEVSEHPCWSTRPEVQIALLRSEKTPIQAARNLAGRFPGQVLEEIVPPSRRALIKS